MKVPVILATAVICFLLGSAVGVVGFAIAYPLLPGNAPVGEGQPGPGSMAAPPGMGSMGGPPGGGGMGGPPTAPNYKAQLAGLVTKIDQLTNKSLTVTLTDEQKKQLGEELKGLEAMDDLSSDEAKKRLEAVLKVVEGDKQVFTDAGYRWPGQGGGRPPGPMGPGPMGPGGARRQGRRPIPSRKARTAST